MKPEQDENGKRLKVDAGHKVKADLDLWATKAQQSTSDNLARTTRKVHLM